MIIDIFNFLFRIRGIRDEEVIMEDDFFVINDVRISIEFIADNILVRVDSIIVTDEEVIFAKDFNRVKVINIVDFLGNILKSEFDVFNRFAAGHLNLTVRKEFHINKVGAGGDSEGNLIIEGLFRVKFNF